MTSGKRTHLAQLVVIVSDGEIHLLSRLARRCPRAQVDTDVGVVRRAGADLLRLPIAAVVVGEEEESRTVMRGIETDVACLAWASRWLLWRWLVAEVRRAIGRCRYLPKKAQGRSASDTTVGVF